MTGASRREYGVGGSTLPAEIFQEAPSNYSVWDVTRYELRVSFDDDRWSVVQCISGGQIFVGTSRTPRSVTDAPGFQLLKISAKLK